MARVILHIDLNAFFASAEEIKNPELIGKPIAVGSLSKRGVLSTANYEARKFGVHSAMPTYEALRLCPDLQIVQGDYGYYRSLSSQFFKYLHQYTNQIEPASIDECYMDVTDIISKYQRPLDLVYQIQNGVFEHCKLHCSIGVAPNCFLAKMASDMRKPSGITVLRKSEIANKLWPIPIEDMYGVGKKSIPNLKKMGIMTIGDFADVQNEQAILRLYGRNGYSLIQNARGNGRTALSYSSTQKSISASRTYTMDIYTLEEARSKIQDLLKEVCHKLAYENQKGKLVSLSLRDLEFHNVVRSVSLSQYTNAYSILYEAIMSLLEQNFEPVGYRHLGVHIGSLKNEKQIVEQPDLFSQPIVNTDMIVSDLNKKIGSASLLKASDLLKGK